MSEESSIDGKVAAESFFRKLKEVDLANVRKIIEAVNHHAMAYLKSGEANKSWDEFSRGDTLGEVFFAIYGIGGYVTKKGERPDIDLLIATNMRYEDGKGYIDDKDEPLWASLNEHLEDVFTMNKEGDIPANYNIGLTKGKCMLTFAPKNEGKKIDIVYVKSMSDNMMEHEGPDYKPDNSHWFISESEFLTKDVDRSGKALPRVMLYLAKAQVVHHPPKLHF